MKKHLDKHTFFLFHCWRFQLGFSSFSPKNKFFCWKKSFFLLRKGFFVSHMEKHTLSWFHSWKRKKSFLLKKSFYLVSEKVKKIFFYWFHSCKNIISLCLTDEKYIFFIFKTDEASNKNTFKCLFHKKMNDKVFMFTSDLFDCWQRQILTSGSAGQSFCRITVSVFLER